MELFISNELIALKLQFQTFSLDGDHARTHSCMQNRGFANFSIYPPDNEGKKIKNNTEICLASK